MQLLQIKRISGHLIQFSHNRHHHIESISPPPIIGAIGTHFIFHNLAGTGYFPFVRLHSIKVDICLKTYLIIAKQNIFITFTITGFPFRLIFVSGSHPLIMPSPCFRIIVVSGIPCQEISFHVSGMIGSMIPE